MNTKTYLEQLKEMAKAVSKIEHEIKQLSLKDYTFILKTYGSQTYEAARIIHLKGLSLKELI